MAKANDLIESLKDNAASKAKRLTIPPDILNALKKDRKTWKNFIGFSHTYRRIRIAFIEGARKRPEVFQQRLRYFLKMTALNKKYGMVQ